MFILCGWKPMENHKPETIFTGKTARLKNNMRAYMNISLSQMRQTLCFFQGANECEKALIYCCFHYLTIADSKLQQLFSQKQAIFYFCSIFGFDFNYVSIYFPHKKVDLITNDPLCINLCPPLDYMLYCNKEKGCALCRFCRKMNFLMQGLHRRTG